MCGISGEYALSGHLEDTRATPMAQALQHRGPDGTGTWVALGAAMSHNKLAIQNPTFRSNQPLIHGDYVIVFNGEIYNAQELAARVGMRESRLVFDGDVLGPGYSRFGDDLWRLLDGEFALAIYDRSKHRMVLVRDRLGARPLHFIHSNGVIRFASEAKGLISQMPEKRLDMGRVCSDIIFGPWAPRLDTYFHGIHTVPPGTSLIATEGRMRLCRYWSFHEAVAGGGRDLTAALAASVKERLVGPLPKGIFLSGGVDRSTVASIASRATTAKLAAYTISYPERHGEDEVTQALLVCRRLGT